MLSSVLDEVHEIEEMAYFYDDENRTPETDSKLKHASLTNLGVETKFAKLDNCLKVSGGTTSVETLSRKDTVATV